MDVNKVNTSKKAFDSAKGADFAEIGKLKEGTYTFRIIAGPALVETIWYPTMVEKDGKQVQGIRTVIRPPEGTVLDEVAKLDESLTKQAMAAEGKDEDTVKKYRSALRPQRQFRFLLFHREEDAEGTPVVRPFDFPYTVMDKLQSLQNTVSKKYPGFLEYGLAFMYDVYISKIVDKDKKAQFGTDYDVKVVIETLPIMRQKKIPEDWRNWNPQSGKPCPWNYADFFTEEELAAIVAYDKDLETLTKVNTPEEITEKLAKSPILLNATFQFGDKKGQPMFPTFAIEENMQRLLEIANERIPLLLAENIEEAPEPASKPAQPITPKASPTVMLKDKLKVQEQEQVQEAVVEEPEPEPTPAPAPAKVAIKPAIAPAAPVAASTPAKPAIKKLWTPAKK